MMKNVLHKLYILCAAAAILLAALYVVVELAAVITGNGSIAMWAESNLEGPVCIMCSVSAIVAYFMSYVFKWKTGE